MSVERRARRRHPPAHGTYVDLFHVSMAFALVSLLLSLPLRDVRHPPGELPGRGFLAAVVQPDLLPLWFIGLVFATALTAQFTFVKTFVLATGIGSVGLFFTAYSIAAIVLRLGFAWVPERVGPSARSCRRSPCWRSATCCWRSPRRQRRSRSPAPAPGSATASRFRSSPGSWWTRARTAERGAATSIFTALFDAGALDRRPAPRRDHPGRRLPGDVPDRRGARDGRRHRLRHHRPRAAERRLLKKADLLRCSVAHLMRRSSASASAFASSRLASRPFEQPAGLAPVRVEGRSLRSRPSKFILRSASQCLTWRAERSDARPSARGSPAGCSKRCERENERGGVASYAAQGRERQRSRCPFSNLRAWSTSAVARRQLGAVVHAPFPLPLPVPDGRDLRRRTAHAS